MRKLFAFCSPKAFNRAMTTNELTDQKRPAWRIAGLCLFFLLGDWMIPPVWHLKFSSTHVAQWQKKTGKAIVEVGPATTTWIEASAVSKHVLYAFVVAEDARFFEHHGFDVDGIVDSFKENLRKGRYVRGGSTISQQVVKMAFLGREKTIVRKFREAMGTVLLETLLSKEEILTWYINLAEFGDGIYGLRAASKHYFQTKPELLTIQHGANLAVVLPSPNGWSVGLRRRHLTSFGERRYANIVTQMFRTGYITQTQWLNALATGNFGRPVAAYERFRSREPVAKEDSLSEEDLVAEPELEAEESTEEASE